MEGPSVSSFFVWKHPITSVKLVIQGHPSIFLQGCSNKQNFNGCFPTTVRLYNFVLKEKIEAAFYTHLHNYENWWFRDTHQYFYKAVQTNKQNFSSCFPTTVPVFMILSLKRRWRLPSARIFTMVSSSIFEDDVYVSASSSSLVIGATLVCNDDNGLSSGRRRPQ